MLIISYSYSDSPRRCSAALFTPPDAVLSSGDALLSATRPLNAGNYTVCSQVQRPAGGPLPSPKLTMATRSHFSHDRSRGSGRGVGGGWRFPGLSNTGVLAGRC